MSARKLNQTDHQRLADLQTLVQRLQTCVAAGWEIEATTLLERVETATTKWLDDLLKSAMPTGAHKPSPQIKHDADQWKVEVNDLCLKHLKCSWNDLCGDQHPLDAGYDDEMTPLDFVEAWAAKYGLDWRD
jgi:hypothetical protein